MHSSPLPKRPPSSRLLHTLFKYCQSQYRYSPRRFIAITLAVILFLLFGIIFIFTDFAAFIFRRGPRVVVFDDGVVEIIPDDIEEGKPYTFLNPELKKISEYDDANPQINDFDELDDVLERKFSHDDDDENDDDREEKPQKKPNQKMIKTSTTNDRENSTKNHRHKKTQNHPQKFPLSKLKQTTTPDLIIIVAIRNLELLSSNPRKPLIPYSLFVSLAAASSHHKQQKEKEEEKQEATNIKFVFVLSPSASRVVQYDKEDFHEAMLDTIRQSPPKLFRGENENRVAHQFHRSSSDFVFDGLSSSTIHPSLHDIGSYEVIFSGNEKNVEEDLKEEEVASLSSLYQRGLESETVLSSRWMKMMNNQNTKEDDTRDSFFLFLSESVMPITPLNFIRNLYDDLLSHQHQQLAAVQCGLASHQQRKKHGNNNKMSSSSPLPPSFKDTLQNRLLEFKNRASKISSSTSSDGHFQHSELNEKVLRQIFTADDEEDQDENEHEHDKNDHKSSSSIIKVIDAGWNVGISANLHADYHTNTMVSMTGPNVGFSLHSSGFQFGSSSSSSSTANISSDENRNDDKNDDDNHDNNDNNIELVDAFGSNCIMIKESALLKTISLFPTDNNKRNNKNGKDGNKKYLIKGAFEPTSHHQFLSDVDLALAKNWLNSASHHLHQNQLALVDSLSHFFMLRHAVGVTATFRPEEDRDDDEKTQNTNGNEEPTTTTTPTTKHLSDEEIANMLSMTLFDGKDKNDKNKNNLVKEVLKIQNRLKKDVDDQNDDDENKNNKKKKHITHKQRKKQKEKEFYELLANESELVMLCLSTKLNQDRTVEFDHVPNYFKSPEENKKRIRALERQHDDDDAEKDTRKSNKNAKSGKKSFEEFSIYEKNQFDFDGDSYPIANYHEFFYEEVTDEVFSATSSRLNVDDWDRWNNKLNVREHQYDSELKSKFDRCDSFDSAFFNNNSYTIKKLQSLVERHRLNMTKIYQAAMCYCDLAVAQVLERRRLLKALHSNYHHHRIHRHSHHHSYLRNNSTTTNKNEIQENQQPKKEISSSSFTSLPLIPDASLGWSLSLRMRLLLKAENKRIFGVSKRSAAFFVLPFVDENSGNDNEEETTAAAKQEQFNFIFTNFVFKPSFRLSAIERMFSPKTAAHHHHRLHSDSKIFEDLSTSNDENFFMNRNWQKFALSLFPEYRRVIEQHHHHHQQRLLKQNPTNNEDENENEKSIAPAVPDQHDDHVSHNNILSSFLQNHLPASFNSFLQKLHLSSKQHLNTGTTSTPFMKIHWHLADCCHCCGFSVEIAHLIRRLSEHYAVSLAQPAECYCQGLPAAFADTIGRSYQQDLKYFFSRLYPHEKILWVHHTPPPLFKNVPELGFGSRKPDRFIARSMYEFTRVGKDWVENVNIPDEWWAPSKFVKDLLVDDDLKVSPDKVFIIPESIDTKYFDPDAILEEQKIRMLSTMSTTSQKQEQTSPTTTQTVENDENTHHQESRHTTSTLDFSSEFNSRYGTDWKFVSCNRGPSRPSTKNKNKNKKMHHHQHHARGQQHVKEREADGDDFAFLSQFKWEPRKGPTFLIEGFLQAFGSNTLKNELSMMTTTKNETGTIVNRHIPQFIQRNPTLMKRIQQQEKKRDERNRFSRLDDDREKEKKPEKEVEDIADQDVTLLILTGLYDLEHSPGLDLEAVNRHNVSNIIEIELVNYFRKKLFSSQSQAGATTRPHPLRFESDQVINDFIKNQILTSPQHSPRFCLIGDSVTEKEMARIFRGADAFVLPTRGEGWGLPTMQAMSMGLPTISTNWGGSVDFTTKETSFLIELDGLEEIPEWSPYLFLPGKKWSTPSISELTKLMQFVRSKKERRFVEEIGRRARRHIVKNFDDDEVWKVIDRRVKEIGQELVE